MRALLDTIQSVDPRRFEIATPSGVKTVDNPLHQARNYALAMCSLLEKDEALVQTTGRYQGKLLCPYAYGVVLPNITRHLFDSQPALAQVVDAHLVICGHRVIHGVAGSGKTLILAYRCQHLAQAEQSMLVLCFNVALASKLRSLRLKQGRFPKANTVR